MARLLGLERKFESDPAFQYRFHIVMTYFWVVNAGMALTVFFVSQSIWAKWSVLYLVVVSLYANFATDYGAVPGSEAAIAGERVQAHLRVQVQPDVDAAGPHENVDITGTIKETPQ